MNKRREEKSIRQLTAIEAELREEFTRLLPEAVESGINYFTNSEFNPHGLLANHMQPMAERFLQLATQSIKLRNELNLESQGTISHIYISACSEASNLNNEHRRGPRKLASWVLQEIKAV